MVGVTKYCKLQGKLLPDFVDAAGTHARPLATRSEPVHAKPIWGTKISAELEGGNLVNHQPPSHPAALALRWMLVPRGYICSHHQVVQMRCLKVGAQNPVHVSGWAHRIPSIFFSCVVQWPVQFFSVRVRNPIHFQFGSTESRPFFQLCGAIFRLFFQCEVTESRPIFQFGAFIIPSNFFVHFFPLTE